jgi:crotonobetainyl-CoA:carnitine CoA-transferase CaiB-like acyl-CoA transferase
VPLDPEAGRRLAPRLGANSVGVLAELGMDSAKIERLIAAGVIVDPRRVVKQ